ncbi:MAG: histidine phosphatase family protein [Acidobacteriota bacterium]
MPLESHTSSVTRLFMVRHGESVANLEARFTRHDDEPLTDRGVEQAVERGRSLVGLCRPVALYASPFLRAVRTAQEVGRPFGLVEPTLVPDLREQNFGEFEGRSYAEFGPLVEKVTALGRWDLSAPGGESLRGVADRVGRALDELVATHPGDDVLVVSHGGVMAAARGWAQGHFEIPPEPTANADGYVLESSDGRLRLLGFDSL